MMKPLRLFSRGALLFTCLILSVVNVFPQEKRDKEAASQTPTGLLLEVDTKAGPAGHHSIPGQFFGGIYRRLPSSRPPVDSTSEVTFKLVDAMEGESVRVKVSALLDRFHEREVLIGNYLLGVDETAVVEEMAKFGYQPMEIRVVRVNPTPPLLPVATSRIPSVDVVGVEARQSNLPSYRVKLRNLSYKNITYLEIQALREGKVSTIYWPRGEENRALIKAGETYEEKIFGGSSGSKSADAFTPTPPQNIEVIAAVFEDNSYEGDTPSVAKYIAMLRGQKIQLARALELLGSVSAAAEGATTSEDATLEDFTEQISALSRVAPAETVRELTEAFPDLKPKESESLKNSVEYGLHHVRKELLREVGEYSRGRERGGASGGNQLRAWCDGLRQKYKAWFSRL